MSEVSAEEQAQMALKLADSVRELVRKEMLAAFEDPSFVSQFEAASIHYFVDRFANSMQHAPAMKEMVKQTIISQMNKF